MSQETWANIVCGTGRRVVCDQSHIPDQKVIKIRNIGNSCYAIGTVNFLLSCPQVVMFLKFCYTQPNPSNIVRALYAFLLLKEEETGSIQELLQIVSSNNFIMFTTQQQQDAGEFMTALLSCLYNGIQEREKQLFIKLFQTTVDKDRTCTLSHLYGCQTIKNIEKINIITLPLKNSTSLLQSLSMLNKVGETIEVDCTTDGCPSTNAELNSKLTDLPRAFILQLNRTYMDKYGNPKKDSHPIKVFGLHRGTGTC